MQGGQVVKIEAFNSFDGEQLDTRWPELHRAIRDLPAIAQNDPPRLAFPPKSHSSR